MAQLTNSPHTEGEVGHLNAHDEIETTHNVVDDFTTATEETAPATTDTVLLQRDSDGAKRYVQISNLPGDDPNAFHDNVSGEVNALTGVVAAASDTLIVNDASDGNNVRKVTAQTIADLASGGSGFDGRYSPFRSLVVLRSDGTAIAYQFDAATVTTLASSNTDHASVIQTAIDYVQGTSLTEGGGVLALRSEDGSTFEIASTLDIDPVWEDGTPTAGRKAPICIDGGAALTGWSASSGAFGISAGTSLTWTGATGGGPIIQMDRAHKCVLRNITLDGDMDTPRIVKATGNMIRFEHVIFQRCRATASDDCSLMLVGNNDGGDGAAGMQAIHCFFQGNGGWAIRIENTDIAETGTGTATPTDGRVFHCQINGHDDGWVYLGRGGWQVSDCHFTGNAGQLIGIDIQAGGPHMIENIYLDTVKQGPHIRINGSQASIQNCHFMNDKTIANAHVEHVSGGNLLLMGNKWQDPTGLTTFFYDAAAIGTPDATVVFNRGPSDAGFNFSTETDTTPGAGGTFIQYDNRVG